MSSSILVTIEIKPYLQKYLIAKSANNQNPVQFPRRHAYNIMLINLVSNYNSLKAIPVNDRQNVLEYFRGSSQPDADIGIILPFSRKKDVRSYNYLSIAAKTEFRKEVRLDFNYEFTRFLVRNLKAGQQRLDICKSFLEMYNISEDELKIESLYRYSSRLLEDMQ